jgi:predicted dehydrogenase
VTVRRTAVVGLGGISKEWLPPLLARADVEVVAFVDPDRVRAEEQRLAFGLSNPVHGDLAAALSGERVDLVINLTPPGAHREVSEAALAAGCDVIVEKPLTDRLSDAVAIVTAARAAGRTVAVMQNRRYHPAVRRMRAGLAAGEIGGQVDTSVDMFLWHIHTNPYLRSSDRPLLRDMAIHQFDMARAITRADAVTVQTLEWSSPTSWMPGATAAAATFELSNGTVFSYRGSWVAEGAQTSYDGAWRVGGTRGSYSWDSEARLVVETVERVAGPHAAGVRTTVEEDVPRLDRVGHPSGLNAILDALAAGEAPETVCNDNLLSLAMVDAAVRSSEERRTIEIADVLAEAGWQG